MPPAAPSGRSRSTPPRSFLYANELDRYVINSPMVPALTKGDDGSLTLYSRVRRSWMAPWNATGSGVLSLWPHAVSHHRIAECGQPSFGFRIMP
jgi:hypothetical protein